MRWKKRKKFFRTLPEDDADGNNDYRNYLLSPAWKAMRIRIFTARGFKCACCGDVHEARGLILHHKSYVRLYDELDSDLDVLCVDCHDGVHGRYGAVAKRAAQVACTRTKLMVAMYRAPSNPAQTVGERVAAQWKADRLAIKRGA